MNEQLFSNPTMKKKLQSILDDKNIKGKVVGSANGPRVTCFSISLEPGIKVKKVERCAEEIAASFNAPDVRILAPIPGKNLVGVEIPNGHGEIVDFHNLWNEDVEKRMAIPLVLGKEFSNRKVRLDLAMAPHILIAGIDASEILMGLQAIVVNLLHRFAPENMHFVLFHPHHNVFDHYQGMPYLPTPVIHDASQMVAALHETVDEMYDRYKLLQSAQAKTLQKYNEIENIQTRLPYKVLFIGELASLREDKLWHQAEKDLFRIAQMGRAAGIHLVVATQNLKSQVITGVIKANLSTRIAFRVNNVKESQLILDISGAEKLLGNGDMLVMLPPDLKIIRAQCATCKEQ